MCRQRFNVGAALAPESPATNFEAKDSLQVIA
jgi:hypothetical protein